MRKCLSYLTAIVMLVGYAASAHAAGTLAYSFESGNDGFGPNGGGVYTQDTIGETDGTHSLKVAIPIWRGLRFCWWAHREPRAVHW